MTKIQLPRRSKITLLSIGVAVLLLLVVSALYVAFSPASRMATARQRWRERAAAMACQNMMESAAYKSYGGRVLDSRWQSVADGMLRNGDADLAHNDDVLGTCMVVGNLYCGDVKVMINLLKDRPNHFSEDYNFALGFRYDPAPSAFRAEVYDSRGHRGTQRY